MSEAGSDRLRKRMNNNQQKSGECVTLVSIPTA